jgi:hypothetical protein
MWRIAGLSLWLALATIACGGAPAEIRGTFERSAPAIDVRVIVQREHRDVAARYLRAALASLETIGAWLGPYPHQSLTLTDPPWHGAVAADPTTIVLDRAPWWSSRTSMAPELATARAIARRSWPEALNTTALPAWFTAGLVEFTARRAVSGLFQGENLPPGFAMVEMRYFGGFVPRFVRIRLLPEADGDPVRAYRATPTARPTGPASADEARSLLAKTVLTLNTLERWVGRTVFDAILEEFVRTSRGRAPTIDDFTRVASSTAGQDLSWLLTPALGGAATFDYAVAGLDSVRDSDGRFDTTVVVERRGDGMFTGASAPRQGPFESGRGIAVVVAFENGERAVDTWDGRDMRKTFQYRSASRATSAVVDPDRALTLDIDRTNNSLTLAAASATAATRWSARWMLWLEQVLLGFAAIA